MSFIRSGRGPFQQEDDGATLPPSQKDPSFIGGGDINFIPEAQQMHSGSHRLVVVVFVICGLNKFLCSMSTFIVAQRTRKDRKGSHFTTISPSLSHSLWTHSLDHSLNLGVMLF